jgi:predicted ribosome-associated RNA-binding protein Tma20
MESTTAENSHTIIENKENAGQISAPSGPNHKSIKIEAVTRTSLKSSQEKNFRKQILDNMPAMNVIIDKIWPKKSTISFAKLKNYTNVYFVNDEPCFLQVKDKDEALVPHIRLLHKCK